MRGSWYTMTAIAGEGQLRARWLAVALLCCVPALAWAAEPERVLRVRGDHAYPPYEYLNEAGEPTGFNVDLFRAVAEAVGLRYELRLGPWANVRAELEEGRIDMLLGMYRSPARDEGVDFSTPHTVLSHAIFVRRGADVHGVEDLAGRSVIVQAGDVAHDLLRDREIAEQIVPVESPEDALRLLASGKHDCAVMARLHGTYLAHELNLGGIRTVGDPIAHSEYCFAVREGDAVLKARLDEGLRIIVANGRYQEVYDAWFSVHQRRAVWPVVGRYLLMILAPVGAVLVLIVLWNWTLKRQVRAKTGELARELAERMQAEAALRQARDFSATILSTVDALVIVLDAEGRVVSFNRACEIGTGYAFEEVRDRVFWEMLVPPEEVGGVRRMFERLLQVGGPRRHANHWQARDGRKRMIEWSNTVLHNVDGAVEYVMCAGIDVTERRAAEDEAKRLGHRLHAAQKLEAVGQLAGGVAHDFNNLLTVIMGNLDLLSESLPERGETRTLLQGISDAATQAAGVTRALLTFSHRLPTEKQAIDLRETVEDALKLVQRLLPAAIELETRIADGEEVPVNGDVTQIQQVVLNLVINARDAMPGGGVLRVALERVAGDTGGDGSDKRDVAVLTVADTGGGIPPEVQERIFEPFYTTKERGRGTGLGLAITHGVVRDHGGTIRVRSEVGRGAEFVITLPCAEKRADTEAGAVADALPRGAGETVLLAEDDRAAREIMGRTLQDLGYVVVYAVDGPGMLAAYEQEHAAIALIVTDVDLPGRSGISCLWEIRSTGDHTPVVIVTGGVDPSVDEALGAHTVLLRKPFPMAQLGRTVGRLLAASRAARKASIG